MANEKSILDDLLALLSPEEQTAVRTKLAANPRLVAQDKFVHSLFGAYKDIEEGPSVTPVVETPPVAAVHTPVVPSAAAPVVTPVTAASDAGNKALLDALQVLNSKLDDKLKNVPTKDEIKTLGDQMFQNILAASIKTADEVSTIRETHRREFGEELKREEFDKFVTDNQDPTTKRNRYSNLTDAYDAMVSQKRIDAKIAKGIEAGVKQKTSGSMVAGQSHTTSVSAAQQVIAKAKSDSAGGGKTNLQAAIDRAMALEQGSPAVQ